MIGPSQQNHYNVPLRMISITPTRDGYESPSRRLPDKNTRLMLGKTLDEWCMLQMRTCKYIDRIVFVCETERHVERLSPLAEKYNVQLVIRPRDMLHPINDTGSLPIHWAAQEAFKTDWWSLITTPFNCSPCRPPGMYDKMVEKYVQLMENPDWTQEAACLMAASKSDNWFGHRDQSGRVRPLAQESFAYNIHPTRYQTTMNHFVAGSWWWISTQLVAMSRSVPSAAVYAPFIYDIEEWMDTHIDNESQWNLAEHHLKTKILDVYGEDCYEEYAQTWRGK